MRDYKHMIFGIIKKNKKIMIFLINFQQRILGKLKYFRTKCKE